jgi:hypothetical protein
VSPTNIMLAYNGTVKILDFGIARAASFAEEESKKGLIKGKVAYLSPEQVNLQPFDHRIDIFALGTVMHEMLTGVRLFQAKNDVARMRQLLAQPIPPPSSVNAAIPRELDRIVMKALEVDPAQRYQGTAAMAADLERTMIAARHSSRDLSKLLRGLFMPSEEPLVVLEAPAEPAPAPTGPPTGSMASLSSGVNRSSTEEIRRGDRTRSGHGDRSGVLDGAVRAEQSRLMQQRRGNYAKAAVLVVVLLAVVGGVAKAWRPYIGPLVAGLLASPPPPPPPPEPTAAADAGAGNGKATAPVVRPLKKRPIKRGKPGTTGGAGNGGGGPSKIDNGDDVLPVSE